MIQLQERREPSPFSLFNLGFRPFFLGGALISTVLLVLWLVVYSRGLQPHYYSYGVFWHAHEMLFGFTLAIIAGFLLTAVRNWTNVQTLFGWPLALIFMLWLIARLLPLFASLDPWVIAITDLAFAPLLALSIAWPIIRSGNWRNLVFVPLLVAFFIANLLMHLQLLGITEDTANTGIRLALFLVVTIITIIGGRVIPFFSERGVPGVQCQRYSWIEKAIIPATLVWLLSSLSEITPLVIATSAVVAAMNLIRFWGWFDKRILGTPLVWILQSGYLFIALGFLLFTFSSLGLISQSIAYHAFAVGGIGGLTLGMMARVSLGHTGRPLEVGPVIITAFFLMLLAAIIRIAVHYLPIPYLASLHLSGTLWSIAWILFLIRYLPILIKPRVDGLYG